MNAATLQSNLGLQPPDATRAFPVIEGASMSPLQALQSIVAGDVTVGPPMASGYTLPDSMEEDPPSSASIGPFKPHKRGSRGGTGVFLRNAARQLAGGAEE